MADIRHVHGEFDMYYHQLKSIDLKLFGIIVDNTKTMYNK